MGITKTQPASPEALLTTQEAAAMLGLSPGTLEVWRCLGRYNVPYIRLGRAIRYDRAALQQWIASRAVNTR